MNVKQKMQMMRLLFASVLPFFFNSPQGGSEGRDAKLFAPFRFPESSFCSHLFSRCHPRVGKMRLKEEAEVPAELR